MGSDTHFYADREAIPFTEAVALVGSVLRASPAISSYTEDAGDYPWGVIRFEYNGEQRSMYILLGNRDLDQKTRRTLFSLGAWGSSVEILTLVGKALGGWLQANDCDGEPEVYIEKSDTPLLTEPTNRHQLVVLLAAKMGYQEATAFLALAQEWESDLVRYNFGKDR